MSDGSSILGTFTVATFSPRVGEVFRILDGTVQAVETNLIEATALGPGHKREQFSLVFRGPPDIVLPQRIYLVEHDQMGSFELFLVPIGPDAEGMRYEAVFT